MQDRNYRPSRFDRLKSNYSAIVATLALIIAVGTGGALASGVITSKDIKNGSILSKDIKNAQVKSPDIKDSTIDGADIGAGEIGASELNLPAPTQIASGETSGPVGAAFGKLATVGTYTKQEAESVLQVEWTGAVAPGVGTNCVFQLRVNGAPPQAGGGEVFAASSAVNVSTVGLFPALGVGPLAIEIWAKYSAKVTQAPTCIVGPSNPGIASTFVIGEAVF
jgi:hypothetical protein